MAAALAILAEHGLPGLSMRRIADALQVQPSALYWHFPDKQTLLAAVSARILAPSAEGPADPSFEQVADRLRQVLLAYPDGAELVYSSFALGLTDVPAVAQFEAAAARAGASPGTAIVAARTATHYVLGFVFFEQQQQFAARVGVLSDAPHDATADFRSGVALIAGRL